MLVAGHFVPDLVPVLIYILASKHVSIMPGSRGPEALVVLIKLYTISSITICLRFYTLCSTPKSFFPKDYISLVALVGYLCHGVLPVLNNDTRKREA